MTVNSHPFVMTKLAQQRCDDLYAWADHYRLACLAEQRANLQGWIDLTAVLTVVVALALLFAARSGVVDTSSRADGPNHLQKDAHAASQVLHEHLLDPSAAHQIIAARQ